MLIYFFKENHLYNNIFVEFVELENERKITVMVL